MESERLRGMQALPGDGVLLTRGTWDWVERGPDAYVLEGAMQFHNVCSRSEIFVTEVHPSVRLMGPTSLNGIEHSIKAWAEHPQEGYGAGVEPREDGYWPAYILAAGATTTLRVSLCIYPSSTPRGRPAGREPAALADVKSAWFQVAYVAYGPHGRSSHSQHVVLPLCFPPAPALPASGVCGPVWRRVEPVGELRGDDDGDGGEDLYTGAVATHLLCHLDDPVSVVERYVAPYARPGDIVTLGESPLALMQGRFRHPSDVRVGWVARAACLCFHPTSSLATACGMQALVDVVGAARVLRAVAVGVLMRLLGQRGWFYRVAGDQAALIDDVTGTLPPYDQFICLGPERCRAVVEAVRCKTGLELAIVDVNDLSYKTGAVRVLAASSGVERKVLRRALLRNPAGNADQQTPIVIIRQGAP